MEIAMHGAGKLIRLMLRPLKRLWWCYIARRNALELEGSQSAEEVFTHVYRRGHRRSSTKPGERYFSGSGLHDAQIVGPYIAAVQEFIDSRDEKLDAVDLGCGDFVVGSQIRLPFDRYIACDLVPILVSRNREKFKTLDLIFARWISAGILCRLAISYSSDKCCRTFKQRYTKRPNEGAGYQSIFGAVGTFANEKDLHRKHGS